MTRRRLLLAFLVYLTLDLTNPFVAGAFTFDPDECVEGIRVSSPHQRTDVPALLVRVPVVRLELPPPSFVRSLAGGRHPILEWLVDAREDTRASGDPATPSDDH